MKKLTQLSLLLALSLPWLAQANEFEALINAKKFTEAEKLINQKLATDANHEDALAARAQLVLATGHYEKLDDAQKWAEQCISSHPQSSECQEVYGNVLGVKAQRSSMFAAMSLAGKVKDAYLKAIELNPKNISARNNLLQFYLVVPAIAGGSKEKALALINETQKINAAAASLMQCSVDLQEEKINKAESSALQANVSASEDLSRLQRAVLNGVGQAYLSKKQYAEAERVFQELMQRYPDKYLGSYGLARVMQEQGKHKEALSWFEKSMSLDNSAAVSYRLAQSLLALNEKPKALQYLEKSLQLKPELSKKLKEEAQQQIKNLRS